MYHRFSKLAKIAILINAVLLVIALIINSYNMYRIIDTNNKIVNMMEERQVIRSTAISYLEDEGVDLFVGRGMSAYFGLTMTFLSMFLLYKYSQDNSAFLGFAAAFSSVFTTFIGGFILFYVIFTGKDEVKASANSFSFRNAWEEFIHNSAKNH